MPGVDAIIMGGGHNGLTCAAYLGMAGLRVRVLERRGIVGGACVTEEFHPSFRASTAAPGRQPTPEGAQSNKSRLCKFCLSSRRDWSRNFCPKFVERLRRAVTLNSSLA